MNLTHQFSLSPYSSVLIRGRKLKVTCVIFWEKKKVLFAFAVSQKNTPCILEASKNKSQFSEELETSVVCVNVYLNGVCMSVSTKRRPTFENLAPRRGQKLHRVPLSHEKMWLIGPEFVTLNFKFFFLDFSLFGVAVQLHSNFCFSHFVHEANTNKHTWNHWKYLSLWPHCKIKWLCQLRLPQNYPV